MHHFWRVIQQDGSPVAVRYVDKKRIQNWLNVNRLQLPLHNLGSDPNNSISQINEKATKDLPLREDLQKKHSLSSLEEKLPIGEGIYGKDIVLDHPVRTDIKAVSTENGTISEKNGTIPEELPPHPIKLNDAPFLAGHSTNGFRFTGGKTFIDIATILCYSYVIRGFRGFDRLPSLLFCILGCGFHVNIDTFFCFYTDSIQNIPSISRSSDR